MPDQPPDNPASSEIPDTLAAPPELAPKCDTGFTQDYATNSSTTSFVPSMPTPGDGTLPVPDGKPLAACCLPELPAVGQNIGQYRLLEVLGAGAFATVFLAQDLELDRAVALKVSADRGNEARTLGGLEHDHIVSVFKTEVVDGRLLLSMQFVPGTTLEKVLRRLVANPTNWNGRAILEAIDALSKHQAPFDSAALRDREQLMRLDYMEAVCWIGNRVAEALAHAHTQGVLHRDIKPANILMNRYGRPLLADFNVSGGGNEGEVFGGTLPYMAPEHLDAFNPTEKTSRSAVDERSDIYSLGVVLYEMLTGKLPFGIVAPTKRAGDALREMAKQRRAAAPSPRAARPDVPEVLDRAVRRCLAPDPAQRYQNAAELAEALKGCLDHRRMEKDLPRGGWITRATLRYPLFVGLGLIFLPHLIATGVNIAYNALRIVGELNPAQQAGFLQMIPVINTMAFPVMVYVLVKLMGPIVRVWRQLSGPDIPDEGYVGQVRRSVLRLPGWVLLLSGLGWASAGVIFPLGISLLSEPVGANVYVHFFISFSMSGLIALTYSLFATQFVVLRVLYPRLWVDARGLRHDSREELGPLDWRLAVFQFLAGIIPLAGAVMLLVEVKDETQLTMTYRVLLTALIALGMLGFAAALSASKQLQRIQVALSGDRRAIERIRSDTSTFISTRHSMSSSSVRSALPHSSAVPLPPTLPVAKVEPPTPPESPTVSVDPPAAAAPPPQAATVSMAAAPGPGLTEPVDAESSTTKFVPSMPAPAASAPRLLPQRGVALPDVGTHIGDFELLQVLGKGAFATVFLARQLALDRQVALKISARRGNEARTLAHLEHDHIVRVFDQTVVDDRLLVNMQFVAGTTLEQVLRRLAANPTRWNGRAIVESIDALSTHAAPFDPAALRDREQLLRCDYMEAVCWIGARVAEALAHAHNQGVLHRDIKPANILMNRYGRPLLADFNVSGAGQEGEIFGGTLGYMAPEHLDAFNPTVKVNKEAVDERSDIYSLGLVFYEMLTGKLPFSVAPRSSRPGDSLREMATQRREQAPSPRAVRPDVPEVLDRVVRRCLAPDPAQRYQSAADLAEALKGCLDHRRMEKDLPRGGLITKATLRHPLVVGLALAFLPQFLGSVVNIVYNVNHIVDRDLNPEQRHVFQNVALGYNLIYPIAVLIVLRLMMPIVRTRQQLSGSNLPSEEEVTRVRRHALRLPTWTVALAFFGWVPGGLLFPLLIHWFSPPLDWRVYAHFLTSFTISGLIAMTYSLFAIQFLVLRVLYPRLWIDARTLRHDSREELGPLDVRLTTFQILAGLIPLAGAVMMIFSSGQSFSLTYRLLVTALVVLGMLGFTAALSASKQLQRIQVALSGSERRTVGVGRTIDATTFISTRHSERLTSSDRLTS